MSDEGYGVVSGGQAVTTAGRPIAATVPAGDTKRQYLAHREEFDAAIARVL